MMLSPKYLPAQLVETGGRNQELAPLDGESPDSPERKKMTDESLRNILRFGRAQGFNFAQLPQIRLGWPTMKASGTGDLNIGQLAYYVDHNPLFPGQVLDWNCGMRTYDQPNGYNHRGTDIVSFPFPWTRMDRNDVDVVASAAGTIVYRADGNFDRNCGAPGQPVNTVHVLHDDGSVAIYLHLKNGSVTRKGVGDKVEKGEYLGVPGSSGVSNIPHVHLELYDSNGNLQDPYNGACNGMNSFSWWENQEPYRNSQLNGLMTLASVPSFPSCPNSEILDEKMIFEPSDQFVTLVTIRDLLAGQQLNFSITRPDGSLFSQWTLVNPSTANAATRWARWNLGPEPQEGTWTYRVEYLGKTHERPFFVGEPGNVQLRGRVVDLEGNGIPGELVILRDSNADIVRYARTTAFGNYFVPSIPAGHFYEVEIVSQRYAYNARRIAVLEAMSGIDFKSIGPK